MYKADRVLARKLRDIDPRLRAVWVEKVERWCIFHDVETWDRVDDLARRIARDLWHQGMADGYRLDYHACLKTAYEQVDQQKLVKIVQEPGGGYRPLDDRVVNDLRRMDWMRRNWWLSDWLAAAHAQDDEARAMQEKAKAAVWDDVKTDTTLKRMLMGQYRSVINEWEPPAAAATQEATS